MEALKIVGVIVFVGLFAYGGWMIKRSINYSFDYEDKVIETIEKKYEARITALEKEVKILKEK